MDVERHEGAQLMTKISFWGELTPLRSMLEYWTQGIAVIELPVLVNLVLMKIHILQDPLLQRKQQNQ